MYKKHIYAKLSNLNTTKQQYVLNQSHILFIKLFFIKTILNICRLHAYVYVFDPRS